MPNTFCRYKCCKRARLRSSTLRSRPTPHFQLLVQGRDAPTFCEVTLAFLPVHSHGVQWILRSEKRRAGIDLCIAELESRPTGRAVHVELTLPRSEISAGLEERLAVTMRRYCDERSYTNDCKRRSTQRSGLRALRIGLPVTLFGLAITALALHVGDSDDPQTAVIDIIGWVLAWLGLWYPFDKLIFYASDFVRENRALDAPRDAQVTVVPRPPDDAAGETAPADVSDSPGW